MSDLHSTLEKSGLKPPLEDKELLQLCLKRVELKEDWCLWLTESERKQIDADLKRAEPLILEKILAVK